MKTNWNFAVVAAALLLVGAPTAVPAQEVVKVGVVLPLTGPFTSTGRQILGGIQTYLKEHGDAVAGKKIELVVKDDAGTADQTRRIAQELVANEGVKILSGFGLTPLALAAAPVATRAKVPMVVMGGAASIVTEASPYVVRTSFTQASSPDVAAGWMVKNGIKTAVTFVSDFAPGHETEAIFSGRFEKDGGKVIEKIRIPLQSPDFAPFLQRARDAKPEAIFVFVPAGQASTLFKQYGERGLKDAGIQLFGAGDITDDDVLDNMGDSALGIVTAHQYSAAHPSALNKTFVKTFIDTAKIRPNFFGVAGYDGMALIAKALAKTKGDLDGTKLVEAMKGEAWESPRGPMSIDPQTRDVVNNIYIRKVEKAGGQYWNVEFETIENVRDPIKAAKGK